MELPRAVSDSALSAATRSLKTAASPEAGRPKMHLSKYQKLSQGYPTRPKRSRQYYGSAGRRTRRCIRDAYSGVARTLARPTTVPFAKWATEALRSTTVVLVSRSLVRPAELKADWAVSLTRRIAPGRTLWRYHSRFCRREAKIGWTARRGQASQMTCPGLRDLHEASVCCRSCLVLLVALLGET